MMVKKKKKIYIANCYGLSILEIIVAMAIFSLVIVAISGLILSGLNSLQQGNDIFKANTLAQEGMEATRAIASRAWNELNLNRSAVSSASGQWKLVGEGTTQLVDKFTRTIDFFPVYRNASGSLVSATTTGSYLDVGSKLIKILVEWEVRPGITNKSERYTYLTMARSFWWSQNDWSGGAGQETWSMPNRYFSDDGFILFSDANQINLKEFASSAYAVKGYLTSSIFNTGSPRSFVVIDWSEILPENCSGCLIGLQIKSAPDDSGVPGEWSLYWSGPDGDEDGDEDDYYASSTGQLIHPSHNGDQWLQYRVIIIGDGTKTPALQKVRIYYF